MGWFDDQHVAQMAQRAAQVPGMLQSSGALAALGSGQNSPQPVPGMPPKQFDPSMGGGLFDPGWGMERGPQPPSQFKLPTDPNDPRYQPGGDLYFDPSRSSEGPGGLTGRAQDPSYWQLGGNRGSGQPINQPMATDQGGWRQNWNPDGTAGPDNPDQNARTQPMGSLQSLGGGQLNSSGMVNLRGPDGSMKAVPQSDMAHWISRGAVRV